MYNELNAYIGQTVTIFTESGGISGSGFTGVLAGVNERYITLITDIGYPPACPIGSSCTGFYKNTRYSGINPLGSVAEIPTDKIVAFTRNTV